MATLKEFKEWLERFPEDTIVEVAIQEAARGLETWGPVRFKEFQIPFYEEGDGFEFYDFRNNPYVKPNQSHFGKCFLCLGESK